MSRDVDAFDLIESKDTFMNTKAIVASNLAIAAAVIAAMANQKGTKITDAAMKEAIKEAKQLFDLGVSVLRPYRPSK